MDSIVVQWKNENSMSGVNEKSLELEEGTTVDKSTGTNKQWSIGHSTGTNKQWSIGHI